MKTWIIRLALTAALGSPSLLLAGVTGGAGTWSGSGATFGPDGNQTGSFTISMVSTAVGDNELDSEGTITIDGQVESFQQTLHDSGKSGFAMQSGQGTGGGYCFGKGLCEGYLGTSQHGYAITIVFDGKDKERILVTELESGQAVKFVRESLNRLK